MSKIELDLVNPRYNDQLTQTGKSKWDEDKIQKIIQDDLKDIFMSIKNQGVIDPIWVVQLPNSKYGVIEGSRRVVALRILSNDDRIKPPKGISYDQILANIIPSNTPKNDIDAVKVLLQTGKKDWGPFNVAFIIDKLFREGLDSKEIAKMMSKTKGFVEREYRSFGLYKEYGDYLKNKKLNPDPRKYTYFQRASDAVKKRFFSTRTGKREFFELITPHGNQKARIPSVALKGGLYHFNKIAEDPQILNKFLNDPDMTVTDAMNMYLGKYITAKFPWSKKFVELSEKIHNIDPEIIREFKNDKGLKKDILTIFKFCKQVLKN
ncbi:MAG: ParB/RepB/Spo0J family partition protein [Nitrosopumilus sp.]|uniref:ParB/RepB/Spo0J family partition protein n=1 Tax=Nitrosopumilus sp. TaxID=2024843 RepID=UPI00247B9891|nr:ParB/RepB/Spo0J family partition protein [Nitrosopumilus sp.]MCV0392524.1 ParB/RepB/Spo0J family partition protein [Nitrosopumilus sp.]